MFNIENMSVLNKRIVYIVLIVYIFVVFVRSTIELNDEIDKEKQDRSGKIIAYDIIIMFVSLLYSLIFGIAIFKATAN